MKRTYFQPAQSLLPLLSFLLISQGIFGQSAADDRLAFADSRPSDLSNTKIVIASSNENAEKSTATVLEKFSAQKKNSVIHLSWTAVKGITPRSFEVQRSVGGTSFIRIGRMGSRSRRSCSFTDKFIYQPAYYYRIKVITPKGKVFYSRSLHVNMKSRRVTSLPKSRVASKSTAVMNKVSSPATPVANVSFISNHPDKAVTHRIRFTNQMKFIITTPARQPVLVEFSGLNGRILWTRKYLAARGTHSIHVNELSDLPPGNYTIRLRSGNRLRVLQARK